MLHVWTVRRVSIVTSYDTQANYFAPSPLREYQITILDSMRKVETLTSVHERLAVLIDFVQFRLDDLTTAQCPQISSFVPTYGCNPLGTDFLPMVRVPSWGI